MRCRRSWCYDDFDLRPYRIRPENAKGKGAMSDEAKPATNALAVSFAISCCLIALAGQFVLAALVVLLGLGRSPPRLHLASADPWLVNLGLLGAFGLQHSGMARTGFKRNWLHILPPYLERSLYAGMSGLVLLVLCAIWQPLPGEAIWRLPEWVAGIALSGAVCSGLCGAQFDLLQFVGLRQAWHANTSETADHLRIAGAYRFVRHPMMACLFLFFWAQPLMTPTLALLSGGMTVYILIGIQLEERDMLRRFGAVYAAYRQQVPAFIPWRRPVPPASHPPRDVAAGHS
jgi:protein-S-isoprenylcysteine O-methyltransferase Ste14